MNKNQVLTGILISACSLSLGFGFSQLMSVQDVREHTVEIRQIKTSVAEERGRTDSRIFQVAELVKAVIEADKERQKTLQEFISVVKVQNELLQRK